MTMHFNTVFHETMHLQFARAIHATKLLRKFDSYLGGPFNTVK